jgi:hypothetical protein
MNKNKHNLLFLKGYKNQKERFLKSGNRQAAKVFRSWRRAARERQIAPKKENRANSPVLRKFWQSKKLNRFVENTRLTAHHFKQVGRTGQTF